MTAFRQTSYMQGLFRTAKRSDSIPQIPELVSARVLGLVVLAAES